MSHGIILTGKSASLRVSIQAGRRWVVELIWKESFQICIDHLHWCVIHSFLLLALTRIIHTGCACSSSVAHLALINSSVSSTHPSMLSVSSTLVFCSPSDTSSMSHLSSSSSVSVLWNSGIDHPFFGTSNDLSKLLETKFMICSMHLTQPLSPLKYMTNSFMWLTMVSFDDALSAVTPKISIVSAGKLDCLSEEIPTMSDTPQDICKSLCEGFTGVRLGKLWLLQ